MPLYELILDDAGRRELDELWQELDFIALAPHAAARRLYLLRAGRAAAHDQRARVRFRPLRGQGRRVGGQDQAAGRSLSGERPARVCEKTAATPESIPAIEEFFKNVNANIRWVEHARLAAEPEHVEALARICTSVRIAGRCRRPSATGLCGFYRSLRDEADWIMKTPFATRVVSVLMSPHFCYRVDPTSGGGTAGSRYRITRWPAG